MATVETALSEAIPEQLNNFVLMEGHRASPFFAGLVRSADNVMKLSLDGSNATEPWRFIQVVKKGLAGAFRHVPAVGPTINANATPIQVQTQLQGYPSALESPRPGWDRMVGTLVQARGNMGIDEETLRAAELNGVQGDIVMDILDTTAIKITLIRLSFFYTPSSTTRHICAASSVSVAVGGNTATFIPTEGNEMLFAPGMFVIPFDSGATINRVAIDPNNVSAQIMVSAVDHTTRTVSLVDLSGNGLLGANAGTSLFANGDLITHQGNFTPNGGALGPLAPVDWWINTGNILGLDTDEFPWLKSIITSNLAAPWTETEASSMFSWYDRANPRNPVNKVYTTQGVMQAYKDQFLGAMQFQRQGEPIHIVGGHIAEEFVQGGKRRQYMVDPFMRAGTLFGVYDTDGNFIEYHPPFGPMSKRGPSMDFDGTRNSPIEFKLGRSMDGGKTIFHPVTMATGSGGVNVLTDLYQAPFSMWYNWWPHKHLPAIVVSGITESNFTPS